MVSCVLKIKGNPMNKLPMTYVMRSLSTFLKNAKSWRKVLFSNCIVNTIQWIMDRCQWETPQTGSKGNSGKLSVFAFTPKLWVTSQGYAAKNILCKNTGFRRFLKWM